EIIRSHFQNCPNFKEQYAADEVLEIIARSVPEDAKKNNNE
ncbi:23507_t:CDS:1, partial [Gigaspora margarita]